MGHLTHWGASSKCVPGILVWVSNGNPVDPAIDCYSGFFCPPGCPTAQWDRQLNHLQLQRPSRVEQPTNEAQGKLGKEPCNVLGLNS
jgi:hypothetical protein